ncbi:MAG: S-adenosylmethionine decarboxylase proenzyme [Bacillariaceae sp.]|jgi:S-adenosylmethionine decarboxylase proenzyme
MANNIKHQHQHQQATVSLRFLITCLLSCSFVAFTVGRITRFYLVPDFDNNPIEISKLQQLQQLQSQRGKDGGGGGGSGLLPTPKAQIGKIIPNTIYTTKNFDTRLSAVIASQWLQPADEDQDENDNDDSSSSPNASPTNNAIVPDPLNEKLSFDENNDNEAQYDMDEEQHLPAGQHLLVDIDGLDSSFLNSEARLATAMISLVDNSGLTLLSYHCHGLYPEGVSCAGVLLESHVAFHTWPSEGVITLDLFTCGSTSLLDSMVLIEDLFIIPRDENKEPTVIWAYKRRGFNEQSSSIGERDTFAYPLGLLGMDYKKEVRNTIK